MSIEWFRDLVICIFGLGTVLVMIFLAVLAYKVYLRVLPVLDSMKASARTVEKLSSIVGDGLAGPLVFFVQGVRQAFSLVQRFRKKKED